jgi:hypothetical protein
MELMPGATFKLVEECAGLGDLIRAGAVLRRVRYRIDRYQGMMEESGMPIPGLHRIEGSVELDGSALPVDLVGSNVILKLEDGRSLGITLSSDGGVLAEGHGPGRGCSCC